MLTSCILIGFRRSSKQRPLEKEHCTCSPSLYLSLPAHKDTCSLSFSVASIKMAAPVEDNGFICHANRRFLAVTPISRDVFIREKWQKPSKSLLVHVEHCQPIKRHALLSTSAITRDSLCISLTTLAQRLITLMWSSKHVSIEVRGTHNIISRPVCVTLVQKRIRPQFQGASTAKTMG